MPIKIIQSNTRVAEVQYICDVCGKLIKTSMVPLEDAENHDSPVICCNCKQIEK